MIKNRKRKGFTLIELVIVIAIIGILAAIAVPKFSASTIKARNSKIEANARAIASSVAANYADTGEWKFNDTTSNAGAADRKTAAEKIVENLGLDKAVYVITAANEEKIIVKYVYNANRDKFDGSVTQDRAYTDDTCTTKLTAVQAADIYFKF